MINDIHVNGIHFLLFTENFPAEYKENGINYLTNYLTEVQFNRFYNSLSVLSVFISLLAIFGNALVLCAAYGKRTLLQGTVVRDLDIESLAVTDLLIGLVGIPSRWVTAMISLKFDWENNHFEGDFLSEKLIMI